MRECVLWAAEDGLPLHVWGKWMEQMIPEYTDVIDGEFKRKMKKLPELYRAAKSDIK